MGSTRSKWQRFGIILVSFWCSVDRILRSFWGRFCIRLFLGSFGCVYGHFAVLCGVLSVQCEDGKKYGRGFKNMQMSTKVNEKNENKLHISPNNFLLGFSFTSQFSPVCRLRSQVPCFRQAVSFLYYHQRPGIFPALRLPLVFQGTKANDQFFFFALVLA